MNETAKATLDFCLTFISSNVDDLSQRTLCRTWLTTAVKTIQEAQLSAEDFIIGELKMIDGYLTGANQKMTSVDVRSKVDTIRQIIG